jgi:hypothetical protein
LSRSSGCDARRTLTIGAVADAGYIDGAGMRNVRQHFSGGQAAAPREQEPTALRHFVEKKIGKRRRPRRVHAISDVHSAFRQKFISEQSYFGLPDR